MANRVPVRFERIGKRAVPTVDLRVRLGTGPARLREPALVDTGSAFTVLSERSLHLSRFPVHTAKQAPRPVYGIGGPTDLFYLENGVIALTDDQNAFHPINVPRLFFTRAEHPPIFGRHTLKAFGAILMLDFIEETGAITIG
jgi:hypothetical protein